MRRRRRKRRRRRRKDRRKGQRKRKKITGHGGKYLNPNYRRLEVGRPQV